MRHPAEYVKVGGRYVRATPHGPAGPIEVTSIAERVPEGWWINVRDCHWGFAYRFTEEEWQTLDWTIVPDWEASATELARKIAGSDIPVQVSPLEARQLAQRILELEAFRQVREQAR